MDEINIENMGPNQTTNGSLFKGGKFDQNLDSVDDSLTSGFYIREKNKEKIDCRALDEHSVASKDNLVNNKSNSKSSTGMNSNDSYIESEERSENRILRKHKLDNNNTDEDIANRNKKSQKVKVKHSKLRKRSIEIEKDKPERDSESTDSDSEYSTIKRGLEDVTENENNVISMEVYSSKVENGDGEKVSNQEDADIATKFEKGENKVEIAKEKSNEGIFDNDNAKVHSEEPIVVESSKENEVTHEKKAELQDGKETANQDKTEVQNGNETSKCNEKSRAEKSKKKDHSSLTISDILDTQESDEPDIDEDFDPSLLCPDISMDVGESSVITHNGISTNDSTSHSPLPYEPLFSEIVDELTGAEVTFDLTPEELELKKNIYGSSHLIQYSKIHCTACNIHLGSAIAGANNRFVHPLLKVLICKKCYHFYTSGEFEKDEDGSELYCRWCGQGGEVLCCSSCAFVFCKRCIRNNFGQRKFKEIRERDDWNCFGCDKKQLARVKVACAEFIEYYQNELARIQALPPEHSNLLRIDYSRCCGNNDKIGDGQNHPKVKRKRKTSSNDPDYRPRTSQDSLDEPSKKKANTEVPTTTCVNTATVLTQPLLRPILPRLNPISQIRPLMPAPGPQFGQIFRVGNTTFKTRPVLATGLTIPRTAPTTISPGVKIVSTSPKTSILKSAITSSQPAKPPTRTVISVGPAIQKALPNMKHKWFEETVRATARVNSNLSYTLSQLNRRQADAKSVEALATVHNKLQEVLSTSINSLIQIRKNLRSDFIAGIKSIKLPPKIPNPLATTKNSPIVVEDDVVIINPSTSTSDPSRSTVLPPLISTTKSNPTSVKKLSNNVPLNNSGFLKVRSLSALQNVASECITIPDDPPSPQPNPSGEDKIEDMKEENKDNDKENTDGISKTTAVVKANSQKSDECGQSDDLIITEINDNQEMEKSNKNNQTKKTKEHSAKRNGLKKSNDIGNTLELRTPPTDNTNHITSSKNTSNVSKTYQKKDTTKTDEEKAKLASEFNFEMVYNINDKPTGEIKKMLNAVVLVKKSRVIDEIIRIQGMKKFK